MLADHRSNYKRDELVPELLRIEAKFLTKKLRELNGDQNTGEEERHGVSDSWDENAQFLEKSQGMDEVFEGERSRVDTPKIDVFLLEVGAFVISPRTDVSSLRAEEEIKDELNAVHLQNRISIGREEVKIC